jgi:lipid-binding SYLF domain-containing protein
MFVIGLTGCATETPQQAQTTASKMIDSSQGHVHSFLNHSQTEGLRNMLGGVRGIFVAPNIGGASFFVGVDSGTGFLMRRHGQDWSDPVFYTLTETSAGYQVGVKNSRFIVLLMTDLAVDNFINGTMQIGGTGGITVANYGISISGAGDVNGGLELLILSTSHGLSLGSSIATISPVPVKDLNAQVYGPQMDPKKILAMPGGKFVQAAKMRQELTEMVVHAWDIPKGTKVTGK